MVPFSVNAKLPSGKHIAITELTNRVYSNIVKYCENNDYEGLSVVFEQDLIRSTLYDIIDKFYILLYIRVLFIGDTITLTGKDNIPVDFSLVSVLDNIEKTHDDFDLEVRTGKFEISLGLPSSLFFRSIDDIYTSVIRNITCNGVTINFRDITIEEQNKVLNNLPSSVFNGIKSYVESISKHFDNFTIISSVEDLDIKHYKINLISNGVMVFLASIFSNGLNDFYRTMYDFINKVKGQGDLFYNLTPIESKLMINMCIGEMEERNKELQNQNEDIN